MKKAEHMTGSKRGAALMLQSLGVSFSPGGTAVPVLEAITLHVAPGEIIAICGVSGAGKSTLLRVLAGLHRPTTGTYTCDGIIVRETPSGVGYVVQDFYRSLFAWVCVGGNLLLALRRSSLGKIQKQGRVSEVLAEVGLAGKEEAGLWQLSGGMVQRVAIARALVGDSRLLLMDEPFASVDAHVRAELEDLTLSIARSHNITTVLVTHDIDEAIYMADRVVVLSGQPASVAADIALRLEVPRDQLATKESPLFGVYRREVVSTMWPEKEVE